MPMIKIQFDNEKVNTDEILTLSNAIQKIVSETTGIEDVFVYGNSSEIKVKIAPIEIFVEMSAGKIDDADVLVKQIKDKLSEWKKQNSYSHPINLTLIPMNWKVEVNIWLKKFKTFDKEIAFLKEEVSKLPPLTEKQERKLDMIADLLADDFFAKLAEGKLRKPEKRAKQSVRK